MAITYSPVEYKGDHFAEIFSEILHGNDTVEKNLVRVLDDIKTETFVTELSGTMPRQAYISGAPTSSGGVTASDYIVKPIKGMYYQELDMETLRFSRFSKDMSSGAAAIVSSEFEKAALAYLSPLVSHAIESEFWNGATAATKTAVAALTPGTGQTSVGAAEQTYVAAAPTTLHDGIVTTLIYDRSAVGKRIKVAGTTLTAANIDAEVAKVFEKIPAVVLHKSEPVAIYAPYAVKQFIMSNNVSQTYRDKFVVTTSGEIFYQGIKFEFVPLPENCMIAARPSDLILGTDLTADFGSFRVEKIAANREDMFFKGIISLDAAVVIPQQKVLYLG